MKLLISHFFNEEYLLPYWLKHHRELFDHGILIDYHSTDRSVEICKELVPHWEIVTSENKLFTGIMCDFEVMLHEKRFPDAWKLALNTTEFLVGDHLDSVTTWLDNNDYLAGKIPAAIMVDDETNSLLNPDLPLVNQKHYGFWELDFPFDELDLWWIRFPLRSRLLHHYTIGAYTPGRHGSNLPRQHNINKEQLAIYWYAYSPWNEQFISRKDQIKNKVDPKDHSTLGFGRQHMALRNEMAERRNLLLTYSHKLKSREGS